MKKLVLLTLISLFASILGVTSACAEDTVAGIVKIANQIAAGINPDKHGVKSFTETTEVIIYDDGKGVLRKEMPAEDLAALDAAFVKVIAVLDQKKPMTAGQKDFFSYYPLTEHRSRLQATLEEVRSIKPSK